MVTEELNKVAQICIDAIGFDFTYRLRKKEYVFARAAFYRVCKDEYDRIATLEKLGEICNVKHPTVCVSLNNTDSFYNGGFLMVDEYNDIAKKFKKAIKEDKTLRPKYLLKAYKNSSYGLILSLKDEIKYLREKIKEPLPERSFIDEINELPADLKQEFEKYKWLPFKKMQESREHYKMNVEHKPVY